ncbi:hypothetical protein ACFSC6_14040 [Rufibacter sediminis]|uniref:hypothetical protein n=1 Tax=Rufibacter sediminis TaxID=2762756 RepID=UPI001F505BCB|nr:hypothetical protein [Rufibacter sediminis]
MKPYSIVYMAALVILTSCELMPRNSTKDCRQQCPDSDNPEACYDFCDCIHANCQPLDKCLNEYEQAKKHQNRTP